MQWPGQDDWLGSARNTFTVDGLTEGYVKRSGLFSFWWINRAGHSVSFIINAFLAKVTDKNIPLCKF